MKTICTEYRRLWILLNNHVSVTFERAPLRTKYGNPFANFVVEMQVGPFMEMQKSQLPDRMFAPERSKE
jgi:hypothetical protein